MATLKPVLKDKKNNGTYNIKILLVHKGLNAYIKTDYHINKHQLKNSRIVDHPNADIINKRLNDLLADYYRRLDDIRIKINHMAVQEIKEYLTSHESNEYIDIIKYINIYISECKTTSTKEVYRALLNHLIKFNKKDYLPSVFITRKFLEQFEKYLRLNGLSDMGIWTYMGRFRAIFNWLINDERELIKSNENPFRYYKVSKLKTETQPRALDTEILKLLFNICPINKDERIALDIFKLDLLLIGINPKDLYEIENGGGKIIMDRLNFYRSKTEVAHSIKIEPEASVLIKLLHGNKMLFKFQEEYANHKNFNKYTNKFLNRIAENLGIQELTLGYAQYTWATVAFNECEISESIIDFALAHKVSKTLAGAHYIKKQRSLMDIANRKVIDFLY